MCIRDSFWLVGGLLTLIYAAVFGLLAYFISEHDPIWGLSLIHIFAAVKKYTDLQELDAAVLRAFIDRIEVSHVDKKSRTREITIVYNLSLIHI